MRKGVYYLISGLLSLSGLFSFSGTITNDTTWTGTVVLTGDVVVASGVLTIAPGAVIKAVKTDKEDSTNNLAGDGRVGIQITGSGAVYAVGTEQNLITFTSAEAVPAKGDWFSIEMYKLTNDAATQFKYCYFEYGHRAFTVGSPERAWDVLSYWQEPSDLTVDHCVLTKMENDAVYIANDGVLTFTNSVIYDTEMGIFLRGTTTNFIENTYIANTSNAINLVADKPGDPNHRTEVTVDHLTMYNTDMTFTTIPLWWTGYGIYCTSNDGDGILHLTNSILVQSTLANLKEDTDNEWAVTNDYNCWSTGLLGWVNIENGTMGAHDLEDVDPLFVDAAGCDFRLDASSPCIGTANDGTNRGGWQSGALWWKDLVMPPTGIAGSEPDGIGANLVRLRQSFNGSGSLVLAVPTEQHLQLVLYDQAGNRRGILADRDYLAGTYPLALPGNVPAGIYLVRSKGVSLQLLKIALLK